MAWVPIKLLSFPNQIEVEVGCDICSNFPGTDQCELLSLKSPIIGGKQNNSLSAIFFSRVGQVKSNCIAIQSDSG